ncbi:PucR family transcriptional regulator [Nocardiopsis suaedae]|uniref:PucR family transcriptional regulator ligand-binding domain-containing protein n=1 Tax=Nocardiopsis suaedae TaxID=3018444 RepID=A0ABT4TGT8_9ACTN|nr:PucR family transcriptional regulator [Nocardiopsis suaedae]MDA2803861.1 PucR family transcriptional regulator ligand-binding domain-containing protein [Nocardiopsis suaedae]
MRLGELLSIPRLKLRFLSGADQAHRSIRWAYTTDLLRPARYLTGGELVLTGMMWRTGPADSEVFVSSAAEAGAAAVGAGTALGEVPHDLVEACVRHGMPLLEVPAETSFGAVTEEVLRLINRRRFTTIAENRDRHRRMMAEVAAGADFPAVFATAAEQARVRAWVLSSTGRAVASAGPGLDERARAELAARALSWPSFPRSTALPGGEGAGRELTVMPVQTRHSHPLAGWLLVCEGRHEDWEEEVHEAVAELASIAVLARSREEERALNDARHAEALPRLVEEQRLEEVEALLRAAGAGPGPGRGHVVVSAALAPDPRLPDLARRVLSELLAERPGAVVTGEGDVLAVVPVPDAAEEGARAAEGLRAELERGAWALEPGLVDYRLAVGIGSTPRELGDLRGAAAEARHARRLAGLRRGRAQVIAGAEIDSHELLLASVPEEVRASYRERLLGPLLAYDRDHRSDLVETLERFLEHSGSWQRCASAMHVHVNTLRYRIGRVEELTGRDLSRLDHRVDLFLALRLRG